MGSDGSSASTDDKSSKPNSISPPSSDLPKNLVTIELKDKGYFVGVLASFDLHKVFNLGWKK